MRVPHTVSASAAEPLQSLGAKRQIICSYEWGSPYARRHSTSKWCAYPCYVIGEILDELFLIVFTASRVPAVVTLLLSGAQELCWRVQLLEFLLAVL